MYIYIYACTIYIANCYKTNISIVI
jgi:hypothetical protein